MPLKDHRLIQNDEVFSDETADTNKYSFTWRRAVEKYHAKLREKTNKWGTSRKNKWCRK